MAQKQSYLLPWLHIKKTKTRGRGVFTKEPIAKDTLVELAPVIVLSAAERKQLDQTLLHDYIFEWGEDRLQCCMALGWISVYNHAVPSNCIYEMNYREELIYVLTVRDIKANEELFINYNGDFDNAKKVWFQMK